LNTSLKKKKVLSGIQPSGELCISNYIGALKNWVKLQDEYECIYLIVDLHSLTVNQVPADLRQRCYSYVAQYLACGINPDKSLIVIQSHVPEHTELTWVLNTITYLGELNRMTQFKNKSKKQKNINLGLYTYPVLMAADILLYQADLVPVGADQKQHLELSRDVAIRFNRKYSPTFTVPEPFIPKQGARIMSLQDPEAKMSKSDENPNCYISLLDDPSVILKKFKRAVTDSKTEIKYDEKKRGLYNLINIYCAYTGKTSSDVEKMYVGKMYSDFKVDLAEIVIEALKPIQAQYNKIYNDKGYLDQILKEGAEKARYQANKTLDKVYRKVGLIKRAR
jgi:tryptophanyl-tRNA synthetase